MTLATSKILLTAKPSLSDTELSLVTVIAAYCPPAGVLSGTLIVYLTSLTSLGLTLPVGSSIVSQLAI